MVPRDITEYNWAGKSESQTAGSGNDPIREDLQVRAIMSYTKVPIDMEEKNDFATVDILAVQIDSERSPPPPLAFK
ncbi:hypothetical protein VTL71DRAFT_16237 [Oculimacula yallundae]|uniref:Uncharacterized protein n=1 Tax=Oculimacula yallundae TaxID=86028 RepID=A0ABR4CDV8_9HELO